MKKTITLAICLWAGISHAQTLNAPKPPSPSTQNEVTYFDAASQSLKPLEKTTGQLASRPKGSGTALSYVLDGKQSSVRLDSTNRMSFVVALTDEAGDPATYFTLYKAACSKRDRTANYLTYNSSYGQSNVEKQILNYRLRGVADHVFEIIPEDNLTKGEYLFVIKSSLSKYNGNAVDVFAFGVN